MVKNARMLTHENRDGYGIRRWRNGTEATMTAIHHVTNAPFSQRCSIWNLPRTHSMILWTASSQTVIVCGLYNSQTQPKL